MESTRQKANSAAGLADYRKLLETNPLDAVLICVVDGCMRRKRGVSRVTSRS